MKKKIILILIILFGVGYYFVNNIIGGQKLDMTKLPITKEQRLFIKKIIFPHKFYEQKDKTIAVQREQISSLNLAKIELDFQKSLANVKLEQIEDIKLSNKQILQRYKIKNGFYTAIFGLRPGGYIDFHENNLLVLSSRGTLGYNSNINDNLSLKQIKNNINDFIGLKQFQKNINGKNYNYAI